jgi:hypothetical protein
MKTKIFLGIGLLVSAMGFGQTTYSAPTGTGVTNPAGNSGDNNVYVGHYAGSSVNPATDNNVFIGYRAGMNTHNTQTPFDPSGNCNVFIGQEAGSLATTGRFNVSIGSEAGENNNSEYNVFIGRLAGQEATGSSNIFTGNQAGRYATGGNNVMYGALSGSGTIVNGVNNSFFGHASGLNATGSNNICVGMESGRNAHDNNVYIGHSAGKKAAGNQNTFIGHAAGLALTTGNQNIFIGNLAGSSLTDVTELLYVENSPRTNPLIYGNFAPTAREIKFNAKKVGIGFEGASGNEGFGSFTTDLPNDSIYRLYVRGGILAEEVRIRLQADWADYVFAKDYKLLSLKDTEKFITENGHLPNMPSAEKVKAEGVELGNIVTLQQEKIEELTLHLIEQDKQIEELKAQNARLEELEAKVQFLLNKQ